MKVWNGISEEERVKSVDEGFEIRFSRRMRDGKGSQGFEHVSAC